MMAVVPCPYQKHYLLIFQFLLKSVDDLINPNNKVELLHRFYGKSKEGKNFVVQIVENIKNHQKHLISIFPQK